MAVAWPAPLRQRCQIRATHNSVTNRHISENVERGCSVSVASEGRMVLENQHIICWCILPKHKEMLLFRWHWFAHQNVKTWSKLLRRFDADTAPRRCTLLRCRYSPRRCALLHERRGRLVVNSSKRLNGCFTFTFCRHPGGPRDSILEEFLCRTSGLPALGYSRRRAHFQDIAFTSFL